MGQYEDIHEETFDGGISDNDSSTNRTSISPSRQTPPTNHVQEKYVKKEEDNNSKVIQQLKPLIEENDSKKSINEEHIIPNGGTRAWLIMLAAFFCNGILFGVINSYSVIYVHLVKKLEAEGETGVSSKAALVGSLTIGTTFFLSPISGILTDRIGLRRTTILGGIICSMGMLLSSLLSNHVEALYVTFGVMYGLGAALAYTPSLAVLGHYFDKYLGIVNGVVTAGSSVFTAILPMFLDWLLKTYGLEVTFRILAVFASFIVMFGFLFKPVSKSKKGDTKKFINIEIWKNPKYLIWSTAIPIALFGYYVPYVHLYKFISTVYPTSNGNLPVICIGITSGIGRLIFGYIADIPKINRIFLQQIAFVVIGTCTLLLPFTSQFWNLICISLALGLFDGCFISLLGPIAFEICGQTGATQAIGFLLGFCSIPLTVGPPIAGLLYDNYGSYDLAFILAGIPPLVGATAMFLVRCTSGRRIRDEEKNRIFEEELNRQPLNQDWGAAKSVTLAKAESLSDMDPRSHPEGEEAEEAV